MAEKELLAVSRANEEALASLDKAAIFFKDMSGKMAAAAEEFFKTLEPVKKPIDKALDYVGRASNEIEASSAATDAFRTFQQDALNLNKSFSKATDEFFSQMVKFPQNWDELEKKKEQTSGAGHEQVLLREEEFHRRRFELSALYNAKLRENTEETNKVTVASDEETFRERERIAGYAAGNMANIMQNLYVVTGSKNKAMFGAMKAFAIAETIIQTYRAAQGAYAAMAHISPVLGVAAPAIASGMARVKQIQAQQPGGGGSISAGGSPGLPAPSGLLSAYPASGGEEPKQIQNITLQIYNPLSTQNWAEITENNILPALKAASDMNIVMNVKTVYA